MSNRDESPAESGPQHVEAAAAVAAPVLEVRQARIADIPGIRSLSRRVYGDAYSADAIRGQMNNFPRGQFVVLYESTVVGYCATFRVRGELALADHSWKQITGNGYATTHDPAGDFLYGMEVCVDPERRGLRIGHRLYQERKALCRELELKGIIIAGRLPGLARRIRRVGSAERYVELVQERKLRDSTFIFQLRQGFAFQRVLEKYDPWDRESLGYAALMVWDNPDVPSPETRVQRARPRRASSEQVRICTVQYGQRRVTSFEEFAGYVSYFIEVAAEYEADFVVFPELMTLQLLSIENAELPPELAMRRLADYTDKYVQLMKEAAIRFDINIIGGTHPTHREQDEIHNVAYVFLRDGAIYEQEKLHPTPDERQWWNFKGGRRLSVINTDCCPIGVLVCYDSEFPETARHLVNQGAQILFVPYATDTRQGHLRVRYSCHARAIENQLYVVLSGNVGNLPSVHNMDINYAQSCILTPCDFPFARDGIAADTTPNVEMVAMADVDLGLLMNARNEGTVQNLKDRRHDLYRVSWSGD